jgi:tRNA(fMet)-specific endonuclease VapC
MLLLDTNTCIRILNGASRPVIARLRAVSLAEVRLSAVVKAELLYGARRSDRRAENLRLLARFFDTIISLPFDDRCAAEYGLLRDELDREGMPIGPNDLLIAATARAHDCVLVTHDVREFSRVPGLRYEEWET